MIKEIKMYGVECDNCGVEWENGDGGKAYEDPRPFEIILEEYGWHIEDSLSGEGKDGEHYCPDCYYHYE